jgi:hypothetical protein
VRAQWYECAPALPLNDLVIWPCGDRYDHISGHSSIHEGEDEVSQLDLAKRVGRLEAIEEIKRLKARYFEYCDRNYDPDGITHLFAKNGVFDGEQFGHHVGHDQIRAYFTGISGQIVFAAHLGLNPIIEVVDDDHATGKWRLIMPATTLVDGRREARWLVGAYDDRYVRVDGVWLFEIMKLHVNLYAPHHGSWAESAVQ